MSQISEHIRRTKKGKTIKIRPHKRDRNKQIDPGEKHVELQDETIVEIKLIEFLNAYSEREIKFCKQILPLIMNKTLGFNETKLLYQHVSKKPFLHIDFYIYYAEKETIQSIIQFGNILQASNIFSFTGGNIVEMIEAFENLDLNEYNNFLSLSEANKKKKLLEMS